MRKKLVLLLSMMLLVSALLMGCGGDATSDVASEGTAVKSILDKVNERGKLVVGVNSQLPGFGYLDPDGGYTGFDIEFGRAIAAAVLGDPDAIEFRPLSAQERFTALQTGEVDVLIRNTTWTTVRDTNLGLNFAPTTFYDGQGMMVRKDSGVTSLKDLEGARIGVETGTTTELNLTDQFRTLGIEFEPIVFDNIDAIVAAYEQESIDAWTTDKSALISRLSTMAVPADHTILSETMSKEPLGPVVKGGDDQWYDIVKWVVFATIQAEEFGITQDNIDTFMNSEDPEIRRFLGLEGDLGSKLGLSNDFAAMVVKEVGNYGEIFDRYLGPDTVFGLNRDMNDLWTDGGLMYSPPFR